MSRPPTLTALIHLRDFVDTIADDPTRPNAPNYIEIQTDTNTFEEDGFYNSDIIAEPIRTRIRAYLTREERDTYMSNAFFYADGRFFTTLSTDGTLEVCIQALSLMRHPGNVADFDHYRQYLQKNGAPCSLGPPEPRYFTVETSVYDVSKAAPVRSPVACFFEDTKRWQKAKTPPPGAFLSVTAKIAGRTTDTNHLALHVLDLAHLPRPGSAAAAPTPTATPPSKRSGRWDDRAPPSTPSKRPRILESAIGISYEGETAVPGPTRDQPDIPHLGAATEPISIPASPSTADPEEPSLTSVQLLALDSRTRPHRNRYLPKKFADLE